MSFVIYNKETTRIFAVPARSVGCYVKHYKSEPAAKAAMTRAVNNGLMENREDFAIADMVTFHNEIEGTEEVRNLMTGETVTQSVNTPRSCDVSSELFWSM